MKKQKSNTLQFFLFTLILLITDFSLAQKVVHYDLHVRDTVVNYSGELKPAIAVNGKIPMPTLTFTEGDTAEIVVHNHLKKSTSLHWHGLYLPNQEDGVPFLTQMPIAPNSTHTYRFPLIQNGTHWYHSHSGLQEQIGMYGAFIINKKPTDPTFRKGIDDLPTLPIILSEWSDIKPENIQRLLKNGSDWFGIKKNAVQSYGEAIRDGYFTTKITNEWKRMKAMDVSDVAYEAFLINGQAKTYFNDFKAGDKVRLRLINAGASSYFWINYSGGKMDVVANDGNDVVPVSVDRFIMGTSETYDVVVTLPEKSTTYELVATPEDRSGSTSIFLGNGQKKLVQKLPKLNYFAGMEMMNAMMKMNGEMNDMGMNMSYQQMDMNAIMYPELNTTSTTSSEHVDHSNHQNQEDNTVVNQEFTTLNYAMLASPTKTSFPENASVKELRFELTGNMNRYVWSMDNKVLAETDKILIKKGEIVRITLYNNSMMRHPMHLHGHDFRIINGKGDYAPLKNVLDIMPMETNVIEFQANAEGDWIFHCHILYHMMAGMNRVFSYQEPYENPYLMDKPMAYKMLQKDTNMPMVSIENDLATNGNDGSINLKNTRWNLGTEWRIGYNGRNGYETETHFGRYLGKNQFLIPFVGLDWRYRTESSAEKNIFGQKNTKDNRTQFSLGFAYTLPWLLVFQTEVYHDGNVRMQIKREDIPLTRYVRAHFMFNTDKEYVLGLNYILAKNFSFRAHYDSDMGFGLGINFNY